MSEPAELIAPLTLHDVKQLLPGVSERALRETIRELGCYSQIGGKIYLTLDDFAALLEGAKPCRSKSNGLKGSPTSMAPLPGDAYEKALEQATKREV